MNKIARAVSICVFRLCVGLAMSKCLEHIWNYFSDIVQWLTFPTSHHVTQSNDVGRSNSALTEIVRFWGSFSFVPTCDSLGARNHETRVGKLCRTFSVTLADPRLTPIETNRLSNLFKTSLYITFYFKPIFNALYMINTQTWQPGNFLTWVQVFITYYAFAVVFLW